MSNNETYIKNQVVTSYLIYLIPLSSHSISRFQYITMAGRELKHLETA